MNLDGKCKGGPRALTLPPYILQMTFFREKFCHLVDCGALWRMVGVAWHVIVYADEWQWSTYIAWLVVIVGALELLAFLSYTYGSVFSPSKRIPVRGKHLDTVSLRATCARQCARAFLRVVRAGTAADLCLLSLFPIALLFVKRNESFSCLLSTLRLFALTSARLPSSRTTCCEL